MINGWRDVDIIHTNALQIGNFSLPNDERWHPKRIPSKAMFLHQTRLYVPLMCHPVSTARAGDRLPIVIGHVPDKALLRFNMPIYQAASRRDSIATSCTIFLT